MFVVLIFARELDGGVGVVIGWIGGWFGVLARFGLRIGVSFGVGGEVSGSRRVLIVAIGIVFSFFVCFSLGGCLDAGEGLFFDVVVSDLLVGVGVMLVGLGFDVLLKKSVI